MSSNVSLWGPTQWKNGCRRCDTSGSIGAHPSHPPGSAQPLSTSPSPGGDRPSARRSIHVNHRLTLSTSVRICAHPLSQVTAPSASIASLSSHPISSAH